jgi:hypothetical protein
MAFAREVKERKDKELEELSKFAKAESENIIARLRTRLTRGEPLIIKLDNEKDPDDPPLFTMLKDLLEAEGIKVERTLGCSHKLSTGLNGDPYCRCSWTVSIDDS